MSPSSAETQESLRNELRSNAPFLLSLAACAIGLLGLGLAGTALTAQIAEEQQAAPQACILLVAAHLALPVMIAGPLGGWLADRWRPKRIVATCSAAGGVAILGYMAAASLGWSLTTGRVHWVLATVGFLVAIALPTGGTLLRELVPRSQLLHAHALVGATAILTLGLSVGFGTALVNSNRPGLCVTLGAGFLLTAGAMTMLARPVPRRRASASRTKQVRAVLVGPRYVGVHGRVMRLASLLMLVWFAAAIFFLLPLAGGNGASAAQSPRNLAYVAAAAGGLLAGALISAAMAPGLRGPFTTACSLIGAGSMSLLAALTAPSLPTAPGADLPALGSWALLGMFIATAGIGARSALVRIVPGYLLGRVLGLMEAAVAAAFIASLFGMSRLLHDAGGRSARLVLVGVGLALLITGGCALAAELARSPFGPLIGFLHALNRLYCRWWFRLQREGPCRIPRGGPVIVAANHTATIDPLLLAACSPYRLIGFMTAAEYYNLPVFRHLLKRVGCIPVERTGHDAQSARAGLAHLEAGGALGIFPEGGIPKPGVEPGAKKGVGMLALRAGATVVPVYISGTRWSPGVARAFFRRHRARVRFARPVEATARRGAEPVRQANQELADLILAEIRRLKPPDS
jgi:1-acyl-sn-glycerol-3-phosphate acyltransferase